MTQGKVRGNGKRVLKKTNGQNKQGPFNVKKKTVGLKKGGTTPPRRGKGGRQGGITKHNHGAEKVKEKWGGRAKKKGTVAKKYWVGGQTRNYYGNKSSCLDGRALGGLQHSGRNGPSRGVLVEKDAS